MGTSRDSGFGFGGDLMLGAGRWFVLLNHLWGWDLPWISALTAFSDGEGVRVLGRLVCFVEGRGKEESSVLFGIVVVPPKFVGKLRVASLACWTYSGCCVCYLQRPSGQARGKCLSQRGVRRNIPSGFLFTLYSQTTPPTTLALVRIALQAAKCFRSCCCIWF